MQTPYVGFSNSIVKGNFVNKVNGRSATLRQFSQITCFTGTKVQYLRLLA
jgi:hypothetical protein